MVDGLPHPVPVLDATDVVLGVVGGGARFHRFAQLHPGGIVQYVNRLVRASGKGHQFRQIQMIVLHGHGLVGVGGHVAVHVVEVVASSAGLETFGVAGGVGDCFDFVRPGGVGVAKIVNLSKVPTRTGQGAALPLEGADVSTGVGVGEALVVAAVAGEDSSIYTYGNIL